MGTQAVCPQFGQRGSGPAGSQDGQGSPHCDPPLCVQGRLLWWPGSSRGANGFMAFESPLILRFSIRKTQRTLRLLDFAATDNNSGRLGVALWPHSPQRSGLPRGLGSPGRPFCGRPGGCVFVVVLLASCGPPVPGPE